MLEITAAENEPPSRILAELTRPSAKKIYAKGRECEAHSSRARARTVLPSIYQATASTDKIASYAGVRKIRKIFRLTRDGDDHGSRYDVR